MNLGCNRLTSVPAEIGQLTSLEKLWFDANQLTSLPAEIGQLLAEALDSRNQLTSCRRRYASSKRRAAKWTWMTGVTFDE